MQDIFLYIPEALNADLALVGLVHIPHSQNPYREALRAYVCRSGVGLAVPSSVLFYLQLYF